VIEAEPDTPSSPAFADTETRDAAKAVKPIFLMFILITPLFNVIINNKHRVFSSLINNFF
jgi:hypothetical protein